MPAAPRQNYKAIKIAFKIIGKPANFNYKQPPEMEKVNKKLLFDETIRVR